MKTAIACAAAALLASGTAAAEPWRVGRDGAERTTADTTCFVWTSRGEQGRHYGHIAAFTPQHQVVMMLTDGSSGRDLINDVEVGPSDTLRRFRRIPDPFYGVADGSKRRIVREVLALACPIEGLSGPAAEVLRIAHGY